MKKFLVVMVLVLGAMVVNAQRTQVKVSDLPKGVADSIQKEYTGYTIKESNRVVENNTTTYEVVISKGTQQKTLMFDNQGRSLKSKASGTMHDMDKSKSDSWDNTKSTDKTKTSPSSTSPSSTSPSSTSPSSTSPSSTSPSSTSPSSTSPSSTSPSSTSPSSTSPSSTSPSSTSPSTDSQR